MAVLCRAVGGLWLGASAIPVARAQEQPSFPSAVELITVDAVVVDSTGRPVAGLTRDDFVVKEDGRSQEIASFEAFVREPSDEAPEPSVVATNEPKGRPMGRSFAVVADDLGMLATRTAFAREALTSFLETDLRDTDELILATTSGSIFWSARIPEGREDLLALLARVKGLQEDRFNFDRMTEYEAFWIAKYADSPTAGAGVPSATGIGAGPTGGAEPLPAGLGNVKLRVMRRWAEVNLCTGVNCDGLVRARAIEVDARRRARVRQAFQAVRRTLEGFATVRGRKSLVLLSEGFVEDFGPELRELAAASREANAAIYFLDARGLLAVPGYGSAAEAGTPPDLKDQSIMRFEETSLATAGAQTLADETGGFSVRNSNDLSIGLGRIADESRIYYLIGFYPPAGKSPREWRKLKVEVKRPGLTVRARRGYTLRAEAQAAQPPRKGKPQAGPDPALARALDSAHDAAGIPLRAIVYVLEPRPKDTVHVMVAAELDARGLAPPAAGDANTARVEVSVVAVNRDSGRGFRHDDTAEVPLPAGDAPGWRALVREFELPAGVTLVRVAVRDVVSGAVGSVSQRLEIPLPGVLRLSTPVLTDQVEPATEPSGKPRLALAAHRVFRIRGGLYIQFEVLGAARAAAPGGPRVAAGLELWAQGKRLALKADPTPIAPDPDGRVVRQMGIDLSLMEEGPYDLVLDVKDEVSGARLKHRESFTLVREVALRQ
jgi:VWFA-related protein